jgi:NhaA family Na+:H+ antiporter
MSGHADRSNVLRALLDSEAAGGIILIGTAGLALVLANSPLAAVYFQALTTPIGPLNLLHWVNDALMALFFLLVGLEVKRELAVGQLATWPQRILPGVAAATGMILPAVIYTVLNLGEDTIRGWAIPAATDIAFALGVLALLGSRVPSSLKLFLLAVAIIDDVGAVLIITIFYTADLGVMWLAAAGLVAVALIGLNRVGVNRLGPYLALGLVLWFAVLKSGVHPTIAGVVLALTIPLGSGHGSASPLHRVEKGLAPWVAFLIVPLFGLANAGVSLSGLGLSALSAPIPIGIAAGLFLGKQLGIFGAVWATIRLGLASVPEGASHAQIYGVALLCGIGFTMSLFIGFLAFPQSAIAQSEVKIGVLIGSLLSAVAGLLVLALSARPARRGG